MNDEQIEKEFVKKAKSLSLSLIETINKETATEDKEISVKIALLSLTKVSASVLYAIQRNEPDDAVLELFIATIVESLNHLDKNDFAHEEAQDIIDKLKSKP
jgi:hypothetical protein